MEKNREEINIEKRLRAWAVEHSQASKELSDLLETNPDLDIVTILRHNSQEGLSSRKVGSSAGDDGGLQYVPNSPPPKSDTPPSTQQTKTGPSDPDEGFKSPTALDILKALKEADVLNNLNSYVRDPFKWRGQFTRYSFKWRGQSTRYSLIDITEPGYYRDHMQSIVENALQNPPEPATLDCESMAKSVFSETGNPDSGKFFGKNLADLRTISKETLKSILAPFFANVKTPQVDLHNSLCIFKQLKLENLLDVIKDLGGNTDGLLRGIVYYDPATRDRMFETDEEPHELYPWQLYTTFRPPEIQPAGSGDCSSEVVDEELPSKKVLIKNAGGDSEEVYIPHDTETPLLQLRSNLVKQCGLVHRNFILYSSESDSHLKLSNSKLQQLLSGSREQSLELDMFYLDEGFKSPTALDVLFALNSKELLGPIVGKDNMYRSIDNDEHDDIRLTVDNYKYYMPAIVGGALLNGTNLLGHTHPYTGKFFKIKRSDLSTNKKELINALESCLSDCKTFQGEVNPSLAIFKIIGWDTLVKVLEEEFGAIITDIPTDIHACDANHPVWSTDPCYNSTEVSTNLSSLFGCPSSGMGEPSGKPNQSQSQGQSQRQGNGT